MLASTARRKLCRWTGLLAEEWTSVSRNIAAFGLGGGSNHQRETRAVNCGCQHYIPNKPRTEIDNPSMLRDRKLLPIPNQPSRIINRIHYVAPRVCRLYLLLVLPFLLSSRILVNTCTSISLALTEQTIGDIGRTPTTNHPESSYNWLARCRPLLLDS